MRPRSRTLTPQTGGPQDQSRTGTGGPTGAILSREIEGLSLHCVPGWVPSHCGRPGTPQPSCSPSSPALWGPLVWARRPLSPQAALDLTWPHPPSCLPLPPGSPGSPQTPSLPSQTDPHCQPRGPLPPADRAPPSGAPRPAGVLQPARRFAEPLPGKGRGCPHQPLSATLALATAHHEGGRGCHQLGPLSTPHDSA